MFNFKSNLKFWERRDKDVFFGSVRSLSLKLRGYKDSAGAASLRFQVIIHPFLQ